MKKMYEYLLWVLLLKYYFFFFDWILNLIIKYLIVDLWFVFRKKKILMELVVGVFGFVYSFVILFGGFGG